MHLMVIRGDEAQVEARFGLFGDSANLDARWMHSLRQKQKTFWMHSMELLGFRARQVLGLHQMYHRLRNRFART
jgi:hypothetical protein